MGRGGGGHGGGGHGGGGGGHGGGFHSSGRSHGSSFGGSSYRSGSYGGSHHHYYYGGGYRSGGYYYSYPRRNNSPFRTAVLVIIILYFIYCYGISLGSFAGLFSFGSVDEDVLENEAEAYYDEVAMGREDVLLFMVAYSEKYDSEAQYILYGDDAAELVSGNYQNLFDYYDENWNDDVGAQIFYALSDYYTYDLCNHGSIEPERKFDRAMVRDELSWVDSSFLVKQISEYIYDNTGIQIYVAVMDYDRFEDVDTSSGTKTVIIALVIAAVVVGLVLFFVVRTTKKQKKQLEELKKSTEILNKSLDEYGNVPPTSPNNLGIGFETNDIKDDYIANSNFGTFGLRNDKEEDYSLKDKDDSDDFKL